MLSRLCAPKLTKEAWLIVVFSVVLVSYQLTRLILFANVYGGVEEDSGWFASISRSLAEHGAYATMTSTLVDPTVPAGINVHDRFEVQDKEGRIWFFTISGVGPGSLLPYALILKLFGSSFWSLKAGPLLFTALFLLIASYWQYRLGGGVAVLLFHLFFIFYPHLLVYLGYEFYGEVPTLVYILLAYTTFVSATQQKSGWLVWFFSCGLLAGLALITKVIALFSLAGLFILWFLLFRQGQTTLKQLFVMSLGLSLPPLLWEGVQLITITHMADFATYQLHLAERAAFTFRTDGSTDFSGLLDDSSSFNFLEFIWAKILTISAISQPNPLISLTMLAIVTSSGPLLAYFRKKEADLTTWLGLVWGGWLLNTLWFIGLSKIGAIKRDWFALIFAVMLFCGVVGYVWQQVRLKPTGPCLAIACFLTALVGVNFYSQRQMTGFFIPDRVVEIWRLNYLRDDTLFGKYEQQLPWVIIPRTQQAEVVNFLTQLPPESTIFYVGNLKVAELPVLVGRIFYPIQRRPFMAQSDKDVVVVGSREFSPWRRPQALVEPIKQDIRNQCPRLLLENDYYIICAVSN